jgi:hypothetical protein
MKADVHKTFLTILLFVIGASITAHHYGLIRGADGVLSVAFVGLAWFAFGASWAHSEWSNENSRRKQVLPKLYWILTILTVVIPFLSLGTGVVLTKYAPQRIDGAMAGMVSTPTPPSGITVTTLPRASCPAVSACVAPGSGSYVAAGMPGAVGMSPAAPILEKVLGDIDSELRIGPALVFAGVILVLLFFLWVVEMATELNATIRTGTGPTAPAGAASK